MDLRRLSPYHIVRQRFSMTEDKVSEQEVIENVNSGITFRGANLWILIFAIFIASLGLNVNSTAVIIGAMLISPLMGPIIGMGLSVGIGDLDMLKRALKNYLLATVISIATATLYFFISPFEEIQSELIARTTPTLYDVLIAFFGGAAGVVGMAQGGKGNVIPGVAIATALMPPLCTAGFGLAQGNMQFFLGAFYLYFINTVFICLATYVGVRMLRYERTNRGDKISTRRAHRILTTIIVIILIPAAIMTVNIVKGSIFNSNVNNFLKSEFNLNGTSIVSHEVDKDQHALRLVAVGTSISNSYIEQAQHNMKYYGLENYELSVIQGTQTDSIARLSHQNHDYLLTLKANQRTIDSLSQRLNSFTRYSSIQQDVGQEIETLFPGVKLLTLAGTNDPNPTTIAIINSHRATALKRPTLHKWLAQRLQADSLIIVEQ